MWVIEFGNNIGTSLTYRISTVKFLLVILSIILFDSNSFFDKIILLNEIVHLPQTALIYSC